MFPTLLQVLAVKKDLGCSLINVCIKWPNDTYYGSEAKLGGVIVKSSVTGDKFVINIGNAINLDNLSPTTCLNKLIRDHNEKSDTSDKIAEVAQEHLLAATLNQLEKLMADVEEGRLDEVKQLYYQHWLHGGQVVTVTTREGEEPVEVEVVGIDDYGYLVARKQEDGETVTLHPDGNSFDMMKGLVMPKR